MFSEIVRRIAEGAGMAARPRTDAADAATTSTMFDSERAEQDSSAPTRDAPTRDHPVIDDRPEIECLPVHTGDGDVCSIVLTESATGWLSATATIPERAWR